MIVSAEVTQLSRDNMFMNIFSPDYSMLGVWTDTYSVRTILYNVEGKNTIWFMQFKHDEAVEEFEIAHPSLKRVFDSIS